MKTTVLKITLILAVILACICFISIKTCRSTNRKIEALRTAYLRSSIQIADSVKLAEFKIHALELEEKDKQLISITTQLEKEKNNKKVIYRNKYLQVDTTNNSVSCMEALNSCDEYVVSLEVYSDSIRKLVALKDKRIVLNDSINKINYRQLRNCELNEQALQNSLNKTNTWFNRNKFKLGLGTGVVISVAGFYGLYRLVR